MRHLRSILYALVLAPSIWVLAAVGFTDDLSTRGRDFFAAESISGLLLVLFAGILYTILTFAPVSPAGPVLAGLAYLSVTIWAWTSPADYAALWAPEVSKEGFDLSRPGYGLVALLAIPLLGTALSARRWARYEPPVLPIIGEIGRFRGKATVVGEPMSISETTVLRAGTPIGTPGSLIPPSADRTIAIPSNDRTVAMPGGDRTVAMPGADRTVAIPNADRTVAIPSADRTVAFPTNDRTVAIPSNDRTVAMPGNDRTAATPNADETIAINGLTSPAAAGPAAASPAAAGPAATKPTVTAPREDTTVFFTAVTEEKTAPLSPAPPAPAAESDRTQLLPKAVPDSSKSGITADPAASATPAKPGPSTQDEPTALIPAQRNASTTES
ncbi:hypothetical protein FB565_005326 [Actinoplanes lutulentus]|uniref:Uncharacterized protein n=1 Tax=Actinoplanes lutulentus TaxID=1287878 RepID=A0A327ZG26_9ACTN|nr:hypothetical protein [Actinoplanes lutulentus]MBB2945593.1 hypothetical protein [Actinoplanes lutulentus]RAK40275.1 hypothetical protein B0I29_103307 [Actinoplanes lutulentus]